MNNGRGYGGVRCTKFQYVVYWHSEGTRKKGFLTIDSTVLERKGENGKEKAGKIGYRDVAFGLWMHALPGDG